MNTMTIIPEIPGHFVFNAPRFQHAISIKKIGKIIINQVAS